MMEKLIEKGYRVAICEQLEDPALAKGLVKRDVVRVITAGTVTDSSMLNERANNFIAGVYLNGREFGLSYADVSTGEYFTSVTDKNALRKKKILIHSSKQNKIYETIEVILNLIYPLKWVNAYIPLIPDNNINILLQSFLPFIIGMLHQSFFNYSNKIEQLNSGNNNQNEDYDNIFVINLDTENILPTKI